MNRLISLWEFTAQEFGVLCDDKVFKQLPYDLIMYQNGFNHKIAIALSLLALSNLEYNNTSIVKKIITNPNVMNYIDTKYDKIFPTSMLSVASVNPAPLACLFTAKRMFKHVGFQKTNHLIPPLLIEHEGKIMMNNIAKYNELPIHGSTKLSNYWELLTGDYLSNKPHWLVCDSELEYVDYLISTCNYYTSL